MIVKELSQPHHFTFVDAHTTASGGLSTRPASTRISKSKDTISSVLVLLHMFEIVVYGGKVEVICIKQGSNGCLLLFLLHHINRDS